MKPPLNVKFSNDFQTPPFALNSLLPYLKKEWRIWECAAGKGNLVHALKEKGFEVIGTDIDEGYDFLQWQPEKFDMILTNPPFSLKQQFLERCYQLKKPFALLLPLTIFETKDRQRLFRDFGVQVIFMPNRVNFETPSGKGSGSWFATCWITNGLNLPQTLIFSRLEFKAGEYI